MTTAKKTMIHSVDLYTYSVSWSDEDGVFIASIAEIPGFLAHGSSMEMALNEVKQAVQLAFDAMKEEGDPIPEPFSIRKYSGKFTLRMSNEIHRKLTIASSAAGVSLNNFIINKAIS